MVGLGPRAGLGAARRRAAGPPPPAGTIMAARARRDGWTVEIDFYGLSPGAVDVSKLSASLTYPSVDMFGVALGSASPLAGVASHASPWWDANNPFPTPYVAGSVLRVPVRVDRPIRNDDAGVVTLAPGLVPGALGGVVSLQCSASMLRHCAVVEANPDPLGGLMARIEAPFGCRRDTLTVFDPLNPAASLPASGWDYYAPTGIRQLTAGAPPLVGVDTAGYPVAIRAAGSGLRDCIVRRAAGVVTSAIAAITIANAGVTNSVLEWFEADGGWRENVASVHGRGVLEQNFSGTYANTVRYGHIHHTRDDCIRLHGTGSTYANTYSETGGWAEAGLALLDQPHFDTAEVQQPIVGNADPSIVQHNWAECIPSGGAGANVSYERATALSLLNISTGLRAYRNGFGHGALTLTQAGLPMYFILAAPEVGGVSSFDVRYDENFLFRGATDYHYPASQFFGTSLWRNNRDIVTGATLADATANRLRDIDGAHMLAATGDRLLWS